MCVLSEAGGVMRDGGKKGPTGDGCELGGDGWRNGRILTGETRAIAGDIQVRQFSNFRISIFDF